MNQVFCIGRLTKDIEVRYTQNQMAFARFNIALDRGKDKDGNSRGADFPSCVAFGRTAENLERYSGKGLRVAITGHVQTGKYDDNSGTTHHTTDIVADKVEFIDWKNSDGQNANQSVTGEYEPPEGFCAVNDSDIPF